MSRAAPQVIDAPAPSVAVAGSWSSPPQGVILHGSRSGAQLTNLQEFYGTSAWAQQGAPYREEDGSISYLGWNATIGDNLVALHIDCNHWGWNAREASHQYLAIEFAQAHQYDPISDDALYAFVWWFHTVARQAWPTLPANFPTHAELAAGRRDGKTDCFVDGTAIRARIMEIL